MHVGESKFWIQPGGGFEIGISALRVFVNEDEQTSLFVCVTLDGLTSYEHQRKR